MQLISSENIVSSITHQRQLAIVIGIEEGKDVQNIVQELSSLIHQEVGKHLQDEVEAEIKKQLPELIKSIGSDIALEGIRSLVKK